MSVTKASWQSTEGKLERIREKWGDTVPDYLFYGIDPLESVTTDEVVAQCFSGIAPGFGDIEVHRSRPKRQDGPRVLLRVRHAKTMPLELTLNGVICPLVQVGYGATTVFSAPDPRCITFVE